MLQDDKRELLVKDYEKTRDAKKIAAAYGVSVSTVYRLAKQKATTGTVKLQVSRRGRKRVLSEEDLIRIEEMIKEDPGITLREIVETLELNAGGRPYGGPSSGWDTTTIGRKRCAGSPNATMRGT